MSEHTNNYPKLHNAAWPGVVPARARAAEPPIDLDTMLDLTAAAGVDGVKFDGFDLFLYLPHIDIDSTVGSDDAIKQLADKAQARNLQIGTVVAPIWQGTGGGAAMGDEGGPSSLPRSARAATWPSGSASWASGRTATSASTTPAASRPWLADQANQKRIADCFRQACTISPTTGQTLAAEGKSAGAGCTCSWKRMLELLEMVDRPGTLGFGEHGPHAALRRWATTGGRDPRR